jgi:hypothetical protein
MSTITRIIIMQPKCSVSLDRSIDNSKTTISLGIQRDSNHFWTIEGKAVLTCPDEIFGYTIEKTTLAEGIIKTFGSCSATCQNLVWCNFHPSIPSDRLKILSDKILLTIKAEAKELRITSDFLSNYNIRQYPK